MNFQNSFPGAFLAPLGTLRRLPLDERKTALEGWVAWLNANRHRVSVDFERALDQALFDLQQDSVRDSVVDDLDDRFNEWLEHAGKVGDGHGPNEGHDDV